MRLKDFDFRIVLSREYMENSKCGNKDCICQSVNILYGNEAKARLSEIDDEETEIELWSGFYDKNGVAIFENDIVKHLNGKAKRVLMRKDLAYRTLSNYERRQKDYYRIYLDRLESLYAMECNNLKQLRIIHSIENIGNIHENPKLLYGGAT